MFGLFSKKKVDVDRDGIVPSIGMCKLQKVVSETAPLEKPIPISTWWQDREAG